MARRVFSQYSGTLAKSVLISGLWPLLLGCQQPKFQVAPEEKEFGQEAKFNTEVDLLFVVDNSNSMAPRQEMLAAQVGEFLSALDQTGLDYRIAVTSTDMDGVPSAANGRFLAQSGTPRILSRATPDLRQVLSNRLRLGNQGSRVEQGLAAMRAALSEPLKSGVNQGFLRDQALLAVVFLSDEEDQSPRADYAQFLNSLKPNLPMGDKNWLVHFMGVVPNDTRCTTAEWQFFSPGLKYIELVSQSGGVAESICTLDLRDAVTNVRARLLEILTEWKLPTKPNLATLQVFVDGRLIPQSDVNGWSFFEPGNSVRFHGDAVPRPTSRIRVQYDPIDLTPQSAKRDSSRKSIWRLVAPEARAEQSKSRSAGISDDLKFRANDERGNEVRALKTEMMVMRVEKKALQELETLLKKHRGTRLEPEVLLRLAELHMRRAKTHRFFEVHRSSETVTQALRLQPELITNADEKAQVRRAVRHYDDIQNRFPYFRKLDLVVFNNGYALQQLGQDREAEQKYRTLISRFPDSSLVSDSLLAVGEILYNRREFAKALDQFEQLRKHPNSRSYPYGLYKAAWSLYNLQSTSEAMRRLEEVVAFGRQVAARQLDSKLDLRKEALNDLALFYSESEPASEAVGYFRKQTVDLDAVPFLLRLVDIYKRHSRYSDISVILTGILSTYPNSPSLVGVYQELIANSDRVRQKTDAVAWLEKFRDHCVVSGCQGDVLEPAERLAQRYHGQWKSTRDVVTSESALRAYSVVLELTKGSRTDPKVEGLRFLRAELLFALERFREASQSFSQLDAKLLDPDKAHTAVYGAALALERAVTAEKSNWSQEDETKYHQLAKTYLNQYPAGLHRVDVEFLTGFIAYEKSRWDDAAPIFKKIGWNVKARANENAVKIRKAQDLYLDILNQKKDFAGLKAASLELIKQLSGDKEHLERRSGLEKIHRQAYFAEIQSLEVKGETAEAARAYRRFARENADSDLAPRALWNSSQLAFQSGDVEAGADTCHELHRSFPKSENVMSCLSRAAQVFEAIGRTGQAAEVVLALADLEPGRVAFYRRAAIGLLVVSGEVKTRRQALDLMDRWISSGGPDAADRDTRVGWLELAWELTEEPEMAELRPRVRQLLLKHGEHLQGLVLLEQAREALKSRDFPEAFQVSKRLVAREDWPTKMQAEARLIQARVLADEYRRQSIKARAERLGLVLGLKTEKLEKAQKAYQSTIRYGDASLSVSALKELADCYFDYARSLREMPAPVGLGASDEAALRAELETLMMPMEERGFETLKQALATAQASPATASSAIELMAEIALRTKQSFERPARTDVLPALVPVTGLGASVRIEENYP